VSCQWFTVPANQDGAVPTSDHLKVAPVTQSSRIRGRVNALVNTIHRSWSQAKQFVARVLHHCSNYAVAW